jgi:hypothetical protein
VQWVVDYRAHHHDQILGMPTAYGYNTGELACFLSYGIGYGLIQHDFVPRALLLLWSDMAHGHTRGGWTAPETRSIVPGRGIVAYATPAQLVVPMITRWMLVFEEPQEDVVWLARATPRDWLAHGHHVTVRAAPTRFGRVGYEMRSFINDGQVEIDVELPPRFAATVQVRVRVPQGRLLRSATVNGRPWALIDLGQQTITLPRDVTRMGNNIKVVAQIQ